MGIDKFVAHGQVVRVPCGFVLTKQSELERLHSEVARLQHLADVLEEIAGDYGCGLREPADPSEPPRDAGACRHEWPDTPSRWCVLCLASDALGR
jgi:hypothetical protein